jgi:cysteine desulfurase
MSAPLYLDHNATTPVDPVVLDAMLPFMTAQFANPSATYESGRLSRRAIDRAREQVAAAIDADPSEVVFAASGSEANNLLIQGLARAYRAETGKCVHLACAATEHPCVLAPMRALQQEGCGFSALTVSDQGLIATTAMTALPLQTTLTSVMAANNETGVLQNVAELADAFRASHQGWCHTDAVQAFGKQPLSFRQLHDAGVSAMTISGHKVGGPKGAAALVRDRELPLQPLIYGGGQENGLRAGTENVAAIVGFGLACERASADLSIRSKRAQENQTWLEQALLQRGAVIFGCEVARLPNTTYAAFPGIDGETLVSLLDRQHVAISSGAACGSGKAGVSPVLQAMGVDPVLAKGAIRISLGMMPYAASDRESVARFIAQLDVVLGQLQRFAAVA